MNKILRTLLTCSTLAGLTASDEAAHTLITVWRVDQTYSDPLWVMAGEVQIEAGVYLGTQHDVVTSTDPQTGETIDNQVHPRNVYSVTLPDDWVGRSISVSWDGGLTYTALKPFLADGAPMTFYSDAGDADENPADSISILSNNLLIGRWWNDHSKVLITLGAWDTGDPDWPAVGMDSMASTRNAYWRWMHLSADNAHAELAMDLDYLHRLTLHKRNGTSAQGIVIDPDAGKITVNGQQLLTTLGVGRTLSGGALMAVGDGASALALNSFALGAGSTVISGAAGAFAVGNNVTASAAGQIVLGKYNDVSTDDSGNHALGVLTVGAGSGADPTQRRNAMRITEDGVVLIQEQGDLSMGIFRSGPRP